MPDRYKVIDDDPGCPKCGAGKTYHIAWQDGNDVKVTGQSWSDLEEAEAVCRFMNAAYQAGMSDSASSRRKRP